MAGKILIVDDDRELTHAVAQRLGLRGFAVEVVHDGPAALNAAAHLPLDAIALDVEHHGHPETNLCRDLHDRVPGVPVLVMTECNQLDVALEVIRAGAFDFITKPLDLDVLVGALERAVEHRRATVDLELLHQTGEPAPHPEILGESEPMRRVFELIEQLGSGDAIVLIQGESGTGKELVARAIHQASHRRGGPFLAINCAAVSPGLLESELFGHVRGAFTDARSARDGVFLRASGGTLLLDEIGEMPLEMQVKLLRVLQERNVRPVGSDTDIEFDTRLITATNRDIETEVEEGRFREDLFYRINVVRIEMPPLRARGRDILELARHFLGEVRQSTGKQVTGISPAAAERLLAYDWPGNVRELENCIERAVTLTHFNEITPEDLPEAIRDHRSSRVVVGADDPTTMPSLTEMEARYIRAVLEAVQGNKTQAARVLGVDRRTLYRKIERLQI